MTKFLCNVIKARPLNIKKTTALACVHSDRAQSAHHATRTDLGKALANPHPSMRTSTPKLYHSTENSHICLLCLYASFVSFRSDIAILSLIAIVRTLERCTLARICRKVSKDYILQLKVCDKALRQPNTLKNRRNIVGQNHPLRTFVGECGILPSK